MIVCCWSLFSVSHSRAVLTRMRLWPPLWCTSRQQAHFQNGNMFFFCFDINPHQEKPFFPRHTTRQQLCAVQVTLKRHPGPKRALSSRGRDVLVQDVPPIAEFEKYLRDRDILGLEELFDHGLHESGHFCVQYLRSCFASGTVGPDNQVLSSPA